MSDDQSPGEHDTNDATVTKYFNRFGEASNNKGYYGTDASPVYVTAFASCGEPAWRSKPSWYQVSGEERMNDPKNEKRMTARLGATNTITLATGHPSLASKPAEIAALFAAAAKTSAVQASNSNPRS